MALNNALNEVDLTYIERAFHPRKAKYTLFSNAHGTFSKIHHMIGHKTSINKFKKIEIISENQDGSVGRHAVPPRTTRTDRKSNSKEVQHQGNKK